MESSNIQVYVVSHSVDDIKDIDANDIYTPLFVGRDGRDNLGFCSDDTGDNISNKNSSYCELTGLYWMWKNSPADIIGLVHYRRYFAKWRLGKRLERKELEEIFKDYDIILPKKTTALLGSVYEDYDHWNYAKDLDLCEEVIGEQCPEYLDSYKRVVEGKDLYYYNMFIAPKEVIAPYCDWVFPILAEVEKRVDMTGYDDYQKRIYGFLTERLFDVWMDRQNLRVKECELKVNGLRLNVHMWIVKRAIVRWAYIHIYIGIFHKDMRR